MQERIDIVLTNIIIFIIAIIKSMGEVVSGGGGVTFLCLRAIATMFSNQHEMERGGFSNQNKLLLAITSYGNLLDTTKIAQTL